MSKLKYKKADNLIQRFLGYLDHHSVFWMQLPFILLFVVFIIIPILIAIVLSFTDFNSIEFPNFVELDNYVNILTNDTIFMENALPNTIQFAVIVGFGGYFLSFFLAWTLAQVTPIPRTIMAVILYLPSMTGGIMLSTVWQVIFSGDKIGYLNSLLLKLDIIQKPILWLSDGKYLMTIMILVTLWSSMGIGFLAMLSGILNINPELYEAAYIDGVSNRFQEIIYVTIPAAKPYMLFGAVMAIVSTFQNGSIGVMLSGANPTPGYAGQLLVTHAEEHAFIRYEMGYGAAV
ncbi:MAG: transporter permease, partial [Anaerocolumna sp.]|nr:transporter permease [Anaerocolumna sp.]